jgi:hypothetical protein
VLNSGSSSVKFQTDKTRFGGHPQPELVVILIGSGAQTAAETVAALTADGERVGVVQVRLCRPFPAEALLAALPDTAHTIGVLDRTKEPGSAGDLPGDLQIDGREVEQRHLDVVDAVKGVVKVPVAVKLSPFFSSTAEMARRLDEAGADRLVLSIGFCSPTSTARPSPRRPGCPCRPPPRSGCR